MNIAVVDDEKVIMERISGLVRKQLREYVFDALDLYVFHYLLKPVDENKFREVLDGQRGKWQKRRKRGDSY